MGASGTVMSYTYSLSSWGVLESEIEFPELRVIAGEQASFRVAMATSEFGKAAREVEVQNWELPGGEEWLRVSRSGSEYLFNFPKYASFRVAEGFREVTCYVRAGVQPETVRHLFLDQVLPLLMAGLGETVLHGSGVVIKEKAVVFLGESGSGKSTIGVKLASIGYPLLTDDCLLVRFETGYARAYPSYPGARLFDSAPLISSVGASSAVAEYTSKRRVDLSQTGIGMQERPVPIGAIFVLSEGDEKISFRPLSGSEKHVELARYKYRLDPADQASLRAEFASLVELSKYPCYELRYPKTAEALDELEGTILKIATGDQ